MPEKKPPPGPLSRLGAAAGAAVGDWVNTQPAIAPSTWKRIAQRASDLRSPESAARAAWRSATGATDEDDQTIADAKEWLRKHSPLYHLAEPDVTATIHGPLGKAVATMRSGVERARGGLGGRRDNPSYANAGDKGGFIVLNPDNYDWRKEANDLPADTPQVGPERLVAHETGHILQGVNGRPIRNNADADRIWTEASGNAMRFDDLEGYEGPPDTPGTLEHAQFLYPEWFTGGPLSKLGSVKQKRRTAR